MSTKKDLLSITGHVVNIQPFSVNDGEGIRTTVFLGGCPLRCDWCANPETNCSLRRVAYYEKKCIRCGACATACPKGIGINLNTNAARSLCNDCGVCVPVCPTGARDLFVKERSVQDIVKEIERHSIFFRQSGGGITFSGGEPTQQVEFLDALSKILYNKGYSLTIETSAMFTDERIFDVLKRLDLIFVDCKQMDSEKHAHFTGVPNETILENIETIGALNVPVVVRIPLIAGVNADDENIRATAQFVKRNIPVPKMELLPYHRFGESKYEALGLPLPSAEFDRPADENIMRWEDMIRAEGVEVVRFV